MFSLPRSYFLWLFGRFCFYLCSADVFLLLRFCSCTFRISVAHTTNAFAVRIMEPWNEWGRMSEKNAQKHRRQERSNGSHFKWVLFFCTAQQEKLKTPKKMYAVDIGSRARFAMLHATKKPHSESLSPVFGVVVSSHLYDASVCMCVSVCPAMCHVQCHSGVCHCAYLLHYKHCIKLNDWEPSIFYLLFLSFCCCRCWTRPTKMISFNLSFDCTFL